MCRFYANSLLFYLKDLSISGSLVSMGTLKSIPYGRKGRCTQIQEEIYCKVLSHIVVEVKKIHELRQVGGIPLIQTRTSGPEELT